MYTADILLQRPVDASADQRLEEELETYETLAVEMLPAASDMLQRIPGEAEKDSALQGSWGTVRVSGQRWKRWAAQK